MKMDSSFIYPLVVSQESSLYIGFFFVVIYTVYIYVYSEKAFFRVSIIDLLESNVWVNGLFIRKIKDY